MRDGIGAVSEGPSGNATTLQNMLDAITTVRPMNSGGFQGSYSSSELLAQFASTTGQKRISHEAIVSSASSQYTIMAEAEVSETGVNVDQQMQDLLIIEQSYAANARVIEIASNMIDRLMEI